MARDHGYCVQQYCEGILDGSIVSNRYVRLAVQRHLADLQYADARGYYFDEHIAQDHCEFVEACCCHVKAEWAGRPYLLSPSQQFILWSLQGWRRKDDGTRRFRKAYVCCGRKWGKSLFASALAADLIVYDTPIEPGAEGFSLATTEEQAHLVYDAFAEMVSRSPALGSRATVVGSKTTFKAEPWFNSFFRPLGSNSKSKDGLNPHFVVLDELHEWRKHYRKLWEKMTSGSGSRRQPLTLMITTAGDELSVIWNEQDEVATKTLDGVETEQYAINDALFAFVARIDQDDDPYDEASWPKANPNMFECFRDGTPAWVAGIGTPKLSYLRERADEARLTANELNSFKRYNLNVRVSSTEKPITAADWKKGEGEVPESFVESFGGFDLGRTDDWAAATIIAKRDGVGEAASWYIKSRAWVAENGSIDLKLYPYREWIRAGLVEVCSGDSIDYDRIEDWICYATREYNVRTWDYDNTFAEATAQRLSNDHGIEVHPFYQRCATYNEPMRYFLKANRQGRIIHGGDPVLGWQAQNLVIKRDALDRWMPAKVESDGKIDGIVAAIMAMGGALFNESRQGGLVII